MAPKSGKKNAAEKKKADAMEVDEKAAPEATKEEEETVDLPQMLRDNLSMLTRAVELDDKILIRRVWRRNTPLRKELELYEFQDILAKSFPKGQVLNNLFAFLDPAIREFEKANPGAKKPASKSVGKGKSKKDEVKEEPIMEVESYLTLFIISTLMKYKLYSKAISCCLLLLERLKQVNRQTLDSFVAKAYYYYALSSEKLNLISSGKQQGKKANAVDLENADNYDKYLLADLVAGHKTSALRLYEQSQATTVNLILRKYINDKMYSQAIMFISATEGVPILESSNVGNNEQIRYLYYKGKVAAVESHYSRSDEFITRAIRKCPTNTGLGFRLTINKLNIVTKLLMGEVPERSLFYETELSKELEPYFHLVKSVRNGSVAEYEKVRTKYKLVFERDDLMTLVDRLKSSVIKTGLRNINLAYSKISFKHIKEKLVLKNEKDAELICAKAIRDQIIENAIIDPTSKTLLSTETVDMYSTTLEPKEQFNRRINFCLGVHNAAMKAHKYPPNSHKPKKEASKKNEEGDEGIDLFEDFLGDM